MKKHSLGRDPETLIVAVCWAMVPIVAMAAWAVGNSVGVATIIALLFAVIGQVGLRWDDSARKIAVAQGLVGQPIALTAAFSGHAWQLDSHMVFFAAMAALVALSHIPALLAAAATIAVHHLSLSVAMPALIYPSADLSGNIARTLFHAVVVVGETVALCAAVRVRHKLDAESIAQQEQLKALSREATQARDAAIEATGRAESDREDARAAQATAEAASESLRQEQARAAQAAAHTEKERAETAKREAAQQIAQKSVVDALRQALKALSKGDLTTRLLDPFDAAYDDLRHDFNQAIGELGQVLAAVLGQARRIETESGTIEQAAKDLATRTERQATSLEETAAALEQLTALAQSSSEDADASAISATQARANAQTSGTVVARATSAMDAISASAKKIEKITDVIDDIAFQTNLLALNAGVEAARAGDAGRGFMVVASEVRALAQRSSEAAREIGDLIGTSQVQVREGVTSVAETVEALDSVTIGIQSIGEGVERIALSAREQTAGLSDINTALGHLDTLTQQNTALFDQATTTSVSLRNGVRDLQEMTGRFKLRSGDAAAAA